MDSAAARKRPTTTRSPLKSPAKKKKKQVLSAASLESKHPKKGRYKDKGVLQSLDMWHVAKNWTKKLHAAGIVKGHSVLLVWLRDIVNQFWYICQKAEHREIFNDMWLGVLRHVTGKHEWTRGKCDHGPLDESTCDKELMVPGSATDEALQQAMFNRRWLKDVAKYLTFR